MKHRYIYTVLMLLSILPLNAQKHLTLEYNWGYAFYGMSDLKNFMQRNHPTPVANVRITDNFPAYFTHEGKIGINWNNSQQTGILVGYMNTAGSSGVADYSGSYQFDFRVKGLRSGIFHRIALISDKDKEYFALPYIQLSTGAIFNRGELKESIRLSNNKDSDSETLKGTNLFIEPAFGCFLKVLPKISINLNVAYEWDYRKKFNNAIVNPDWSGFRLQAGAIYYISL